MKRFISIITGKKAMIAVLIIAVILAILDISYSVRNNTAIHFAAFGSWFACIAIWADSLDKKKNKAAQQ
ncbi:MAG: hypothetical protein MJ131_10390 [Lachnospiraceae bacterium]|nr:hypothetical protein [Lachnospiraceae bacterium]